MNNIEKGKYGEELALRYLKLKGYKILEKNYTNKIGEIDLICRRGNILIFVEVKSRSNFKYGYPREAVNKSKQNKIRKVSYLYLLENNLGNIQFRNDVLEVNLNTDKLNHIENAF